MIDFDKETKALLEEIKVLYKAATIFQGGGDKKMENFDKETQNLVEELRAIDKAATIMQERSWEIIRKFPDKGRICVLTQRENVDVFKVIKKVISEFDNKIKENEGFTVSIK